MSKDSKKKAQRNEESKDAKILRLEAALKEAEQNLISARDNVASLNTEMNALTSDRDAALDDAASQREKPSELRSEMEGAKMGVPVAAAQETVVLLKGEGE